MPTSTHMIEEVIERDSTNRSKTENESIYMQIRMYMYNIKQKRKKERNVNEISCIKMKYEKRPGFVCRMKSNLK